MPAEDTQTAESRTIPGPRSFSGVAGRPMRWLERMFSGIRHRQERLFRLGPMWRVMVSHPWAAGSVALGVLCLLSVFLWFGKPEPESPGLQDVRLNPVKNLEPVQAAGSSGSLFPRANDDRSTSQGGNDWEHKDLLTGRDTGTGPARGKDASGSRTTSGNNRQLQEPARVGPVSPDPEDGTQNRSESPVWLTGEIEELPENSAAQAHANEPNDLWRR